MKNDIKIAISGRSGCGNTTVSKMTADALNLRCVNFTFRNLAHERGLELGEVLHLALKDESWDREVDTRQVALAREGGGCVLGSRLAIWMLKEADVKVYLYAEAEIRARRIVNREGGRLEEVAAFTEKRDIQDRARYLRLYKIDTNEYDFADLVIDAGKHTPEEITDLIVKKAQTIVE